MVIPSTAVEDREAIEGLLHALIDAWTRGDADAYGRVFSEDADYVAFDGTHQRGREAVIESHRALFEGLLRGSRMVGSVTDLNLLTPDVAVLHAEGNTALSFQRHYDLRRRSIQTFVARRDPGGWRFVAFHNTRIRPITPFQRRMMDLLIRWKSRHPKAQ